MTFRVVIAICSLAAAGCAVQRTTPTKAPAAPATAQTPAPARAPAVSPLPPAATVAEAPVATPAPTTNRAPAATKPAPPASKPAPASQAVTAAPTNPADKPGVGTAPAAPQMPAASPADTLDFAALGSRLRTTKAIGVLTKLSVKNQADDLLDQFRDYYKQRSPATLPDLRRSYDMLVLKLLSLLQDGDPPLATDINRSRAAIWDILSDQRKFTDSNLMAGASL